MKLPEGKKERTQVFVAIGLGAAAVLYCVYLGVGWIVSKKKDLQAKTGELRDKVNKANMEIDMMSKDRKGNVEALRKIVSLSNQYMLKPRLGQNYILAAKDQIEGWADKADLMTTEAALQIQERGIGDIAQAPGVKTVPPVKTYTAYVSFSAGYNHAIRFIKAIEASNPLLAIQNVTVQSRPPPQVESHAVGVDIQWPIWSDPDTPSRLEAQLAAGEGTEK